jgi:hypothetical protein
MEHGERPEEHNDSEDSLQHLLEGVADRVGVWVLSRRRIVVPGFGHRL